MIFFSSALDREKDFSTVLFPIYDDHLTVSRLRSIQIERNEARLPYDRHNCPIMLSCSDEPTIPDQ
jgi:hypothetical protein